LGETNLQIKMRKE